MHLLNIIKKDNDTALPVCNLCLTYPQCNPNIANFLHNVLPVLYLYVFSYVL